MKAIILAAGYGSRLSPLSNERVTPLLPIRGKPVVEYLVQKVQALSAIESIYIVTNYTSFERFKEWVELFPNTVPIKLVNNGIKNYRKRLGPLKDLRLVLQKERIADDVLVIGGDNLFTSSLEEFMRKSISAPAIPLIGTYYLKNKWQCKKCGVVTIDQAGRIREFIEKPSALNGSRLVSLCLYYLPKDTLPMIDKFLIEINEGESLGDYIQWLSRNNEVFTCSLSGKWIDVSDFDSYLEAVCHF